MSRCQPLPRDGNEAECRRQLDVLRPAEFRGWHHNRRHQGAEQLGHGAVIRSQGTARAGFRGYTSQDR